MKGIIKKTLLLHLFVLTAIFPLKAQVTIGVNLDPVKGAILELKNHASTLSDSTNASVGGLVLPRVKLQNLSTLEPFIQTSDPEWTNFKAQTVVDHIGLMVYNLTDNNDYFQQGIYVWTATGWRQLETAQGSIYVPSFNLPWNGTSFDLYEVYKNNCKPANFSRYASSKGANVPVDFPDFESSPSAFYYIVSDYSASALTINGISDSGVLSYEKKDSTMRVPPEDAYLNVIMIRK